MLSSVGGMKEAPKLTEALQGKYTSFKHEKEDEKRNRYRPNTWAQRLRFQRFRNEDKKVDLYYDERKGESP